jgi:hypothetical protein
MADWYKKLYVGKKAAETERKLRRQISRGRSLPGVFLVTFAANGQDQLDIIEAKYLTKKRIREKLPEIVGLACGYGEALEIVTQIAEEAYRSTGDADLCAYLRNR